MKDLLLKLFFAMLAVAAVLVGFVLVVALARYASETIGEWAGTALVVAVVAVVLLMLVLSIQIWRDAR